MAVGIRDWARRNRTKFYTELIFRVSKPKETKRKQYFDDGRTEFSIVKMIEAWREEQGYKDKRIGNGLTHET